MPKFSNHSIYQLSTAHDKLNLLFSEVIKHIDCTVLEGHRGEKKQNEAFEKGRSKVKFPDGKHNKYPSLAVDVAPYPIDWDDTKRWYFFAGFVWATANQMGIKVRWGGAWSGDLTFKKQGFVDLPHWEISGEDNA